jgi:hypothetical protein
VQLRHHLRRTSLETMDGATATAIDAERLKQWEWTGIGRTYLGRHAGLEKARDLIASGSISARLAQRVVGAFATGFEGMSAKTSSRLLGLARHHGLAGLADLRRVPRKGGKRQMAWRVDYSTGAVLKVQR